MSRRALSKYVNSISISNLPVKFSVAVRNVKFMNAGLEPGPHNFYLPDCRHRATGTYWDEGTGPHLFLADELPYFNQMDQIMSTALRLLPTCFENVSPGLSIRAPVM